MVVGAAQPASAESMTPNTSALIPSVAHSAPTRSNRPPLRDGLGDVAAGGQQHRDPDRHVEEEPGPPGDQVGEHAADDQAEAGADAGDRAVGGDGAAALAAVGEARGEQRQRRRGEDRGADALEGAGGDEPPRVGAAPTRNDAAPNSDQPEENIRRRPTMSPARAPSSSNPPNTSV